MSTQRAEGAAPAGVPIVGGKADFSLKISGRGEPVFKRSEKTGELDAEALRADLLCAAAGRCSSP